MPGPFEECNVAQCPDWIYGPWSSCSTTCGPGIKTRNVACKASSNDSVLPDIKCSQITRPGNRIACNETACPKWRFEQWEKCDPVECKQKRNVYCAQSNGVPMDSSSCNMIDKPISTKNCPTLDECQTSRQQSKNISVSVQYSPWDKCSVSCGSGGIQTRMVSCHLKDKNLTHVNMKFCNLTSSREMRSCSSDIVCPYKLNEEWSVCEGACGEVGITKSMHVCRDVKTRKTVSIQLCGLENPSQLKTRNASCTPSNSTCKQTKQNEYEWKTDDWDQVIS